MMKRNVIFTVMLFAFATMGADSAVVQRPTNASRASISRAATANTSATTPTTTTETTTETVSETMDAPAEPEVIIQNKSSLFDTTLGNASASSTDVAGTTLAEMVRAQRAALDAASNAAANTLNMSNNKNTCDIDLRACMADKCGSNFMNCATDTDTTFSTKLDSCRRNTKCNTAEFTTLSAEIKADRSANIKLKTFNDIIDCGQSYDTCIIEQCGTKYSKCLGKSAGDTAISKCASIANQCKSMDNGLASRTMDVFATLRQTAEKQIAVDEQKLYALRDQMRATCARFGAMFDDRSLDCVYTVNFRAGDDATLYASKKLYAGNSFDCTPNWFGIDITTFRENAARLTREQSSATSAVAGAGAGMAIGAATSGAFSRAIDTHNTDKEKQDNSETTETK